MPGDKKMTTFSHELLEILVCPENYTSLTLAETELLERLNAAITQGSLVNRAGQKIEKPLEAGLVREDQTLLYQITDGIPIMLLDEAIPLDQLTA